MHRWPTWSGRLPRWAWQQHIGIESPARNLTVRARRPSTCNRGRSREQREQAVPVALAELRRASGYQRGLAARPAREHGGIPRSWQRAVTEARTLYDHEQQGGGREHGLGQGEGAAQTGG
jgi:hypothetical protein